MATYAELFDLSQDLNLVRRLTVAVAIAAEAIRAEDGATPDHDARVLWAKRALNNPDGMARQLLLCALAQNAGLSPAQIQNASDAALQSATSNAIALLM